MKRLLLLVMLLMLNGALLNVTDIYATTENSQLPDIDQNNSIVQENLTELLYNENIQSSADASDENAGSANDSSWNNQDISEKSSNSSAYSELNNSNSNVTNVQNSTDAAGDNTYQNVRGIWLKAEDVGILDVDKIKGAGITDIFIKSNLLTGPLYQNVLNALLNKVNGTNIRVHAWITCFKDTNDNWIDPANETQRTFLLNKINEIVRNYKIDGIHLDYVRYSGVGNNAAYNHQNATETITSFVKDVYTLVKSINAKLAVSAAVMPECSVNAYYYGQDYAKLAPYLDFLVPMIYKGNYGKDTSWIGTTTKYIVEHSNGKPVISGLQTYRSDNNVAEILVSELKNDINSAVNNGASGYALFRYGLIDEDFFNAQNVEPVTFTVSQIKDAASRVRAYVETYKKLPNYVQITSYQVSMSQFLKLLTTALLQINNGNTSSITLKDYSAPTNSKDTIVAGNILKSEYLKIASDIKNYMDSSGKAPDYAYKTSLGTYLGFENLVYMYAMILDYHNSSGKMADYAVMKPWSAISHISSDSSAVTFTISQIKDAASRVRDYVENNHKLPNYVQISTYQVNMNQFLEMLTTALLQINNGNSNSIVLKNFSAPTNSMDDIVAGNILKSEYLKIASDVKNYMDSSGRSPDYAYKTHLGTYLGFENLVYMYAMILDYHNSSGKMADYAVMKPWAVVSNSDPNTVTFSISQIKDAASRVRAFIEQNKSLPNYVQISTYQVSMPQFLEMLTTALLQIKSGTNKPITLKSFNSPANPKDNIVAGKILKSEYLKIASDVKNYMDSNSNAPNYAYKTSLGTYLGFQNLVYMYSMILDYYSTSGKMADYAVMKPWAVVSGSSSIPVDLQQYLAETANCQVNDAQIQALAASIASEHSTTYDKAVAIFNWVRDNISYSFYYNTQYGAVGTLNAETGNCVDTSHLLIALERAAGIPTKYVHGYAQFSSGNWYGHVWANVYVDGVWHIADASSSRNSFGTINSWNRDTATIYNTYIELPF